MNDVSNNIIAFN